jgi:undecaprenyl pyrophosphate phosphatase UppP
MRHLPTILLVLSFPVGIVGYTVASNALEAMELPNDARSFVILFVPLFVAGLFMVPFLIPFIDRKAKADLAAYRAIQPALTKDAEPPVDSDPAPDQPES